MIERVLEGLGINFINKIAGGLVVATLFTLIFSVILWFADRARLIPDTAKEQSITYPYLQALPSQAKTFAEQLRPFFESTYEQGVDTLDELERKAKDRKE